jgi:hypothetical protein
MNIEKKLTLPRLAAMVEMYSAAEDDDYYKRHFRGLPLMARFYTKVMLDNQTGCWNWTGATNSDGYSNFSFNGRDCTGHRFIMEYLYWEIPKELVVHHECSNRRCVNPSHLAVVTHAENMRLARREQCKRGHLKSGENLYVNPNDGSRRCRTCQREFNQKKTRLMLKLPSDTKHKGLPLAT